MSGPWGLKCGGPADSGKLPAGPFTTANHGEATMVFGNNSAYAREFHAKAPTPSRRGILAGIAGTLTLATGAVGAVALQSASPGNPDAELIALCDRYIAVWAAFNDALTRAGDAQEAARHRRPECPAELYEPLELATGPAEPPNYPRSDKPTHWDRETLANYAKAGSKSMTSNNRQHKSDGMVETTIQFIYEPVPEETRVRCRYLLTVHDRWDAECEAVQDDLPALEAVSDEADQRCKDTLAEILDYEPETLAGIAAMSRAALQTDMLATSSDEHEGLEETIFKAIVRLERERNAKGGAA